VKLRFALLAGLLASAVVCAAQNSASADQRQAPPPAQEGEKRIFGMPTYGTVEGIGMVAPLPPAQKFRLALTYIDPYTFGFVALRAGIEQATDSKHDYGQGAQGYAKRYGADFADGMSNAIFVTGVFPSLLHQDPRYFRMGRGSFLQRTGYATSRVLITRQDSGRSFFNFSEVLGNAASSGLSTAYYPDDERTAGDFAVRAGIEFGFDAGFDVLKEFYPDIMRKIFKKKTR
jgi:hypothetical protein